ncbi:hypothetical protein J27TS7_28430 [Paenibacillus dendritiformis]|nr:hypothetical protein J27TS7_28430 [Paenibacillus dendritiformis]
MCIPVASIPFPGWKVFVSEYFEKKPGVFKSENNNMLVTEKELFESILNGIEMWRKGSERTFSIWLDNELVTNNFEKYIPNKNDKCISCYINRIVGSPKSKDFTYSQYNLQCNHLDIWRKGAKYLEGLLNIIGIPSGGIDIDTFLGNYKSTPRGVHTDQASTFMHIIKGKKKMLVWPPEYFQELENTSQIKIVGSRLRKTIIDFDFSRVASDAILLEGEPGEILYWPSSYWHISVFDSDNHPSVICNVGIYREEFSSFLSEIGIQCIKTATKNYIDLKTYSYPDKHSEYQIPKEEQDYLNKLRLLINNTYIEEYIQQKWIERMSACGYKSGFPLLQVREINGKEFIRDSVIYWSIHKTKSTIRIYGNGNSIEHSDLTIIPVLRYINKLRNVEIETLYSIFRIQQESIIQIIKILLSLRILRSV